MADIQKSRLKKSLIRKKQLLIDNDDLKQQMYTQNRELAATNNMLSLLRKIDTLVLDSHEDLGVLCSKISQAIIDNSSYPFVAIMVKPLRHEFIELKGVAALTIPNLDLGKYVVHMDEYLGWSGETENIHWVSASHISAERIAKLLKKPEKLVSDLRSKTPFKSLAVVKLTAQTRLVGLLVVGLNQEYKEVSEKERLLLERLSRTVGIALDNQLLLEENQHVLRQLQRSNEKLKALDETKDEFISMASHQLRTPLTSMKGYVSMVMEGDAGKITAQQKKLLDQAFISSQRMVYLIADLLNVSRLRTGKFVIDAVPTNLAEIVEGEVGQLIDTARSRNLTLKYLKPKKFPTLCVDETKIRQVMMNFIDNAIYYTPAGGHITVELKDVGKSIEYTVTDDGIGVPSSERHHLFGKFYRAGNAQKARPDGTGLGLFMAKKVIIAQGGSLIFKSQEGKGSTFGFAFEKSKLQAPETNK